MGEGTRWTQALLSWILQCRRMKKTGKKKEIYHVVKSEVEENKVGLEESMPARQGQG